MCSKNKGADQLSMHRRKSGFLSGMFDSIHVMVKTTSSNYENMPMQYTEIFKRACHKPSSFVNGMMECAKSQIFFKLL